MRVEISSLLHILNPDNTGTFNRLLVHAIGLNEAVIYSSLVAKFAYYNSNDLLDDEGYFYSTADDLLESTGLTRYQQDKIIKLLSEKGLIDYKLKGLPAKRHFKVFYDGKALEPLLQTGLKKLENLKTKKSNQDLKKLENLDLKKLESKDKRNLKQNISNINISDKTKDIKENNNSLFGEEPLKNEQKKLPTSDKVDINKLNEQFDLLWSLYPKGRKQGKDVARKAFVKAIKDGVEFEDIKKGLLAYKQHLESQKIEIKYTKQGQTWFNQKCWEDEYEDVTVPTNQEQDERLGIWL